MKTHNYYVYITTNPAKTVLYIGVTNNLVRRIAEHRANKGKPRTFAGRYYCYNLLYYEHYTDIRFAIMREKELKLWTRAKKDALIKSVNPRLHFIRVF